MSHVAYNRFHWGAYREKPGATPNPDVAAVARAYSASKGLPAPRDVKVALSPAEGRALANAYERAVDASTSAQMRASYAAFNREVAEQYAALRAAGYRIEPWSKTGQPYANSAEMMADVRDHKHLWYFRSTEGTVPHALLSHAENERFRAVHDIFGHAKGGNQFGPNGETSAYASHVQMFSREARPAVTTETLGQNAWFNYGPHSHLPVTERPFAEQKAVAVPEELYAPVIARGAGEARRRHPARASLRPAWTGRPR